VAQMADMYRIYAYLHNEMISARPLLSPQTSADVGQDRQFSLAGTAAPANDRHEVQLAFHAHPLVFFPYKARAGLHGQSGHFVSLAMLRLLDRTGVVEELEDSPLRVVAQHYTKAAGFDPDRYLRPHFR
jgi:hypothetical protein